MSSRVKSIFILHVFIITTSLCSDSRIIHMPNNPEKKSLRVFFTPDQDIRTNIVSSNASASIELATSSPDAIIIGSRELSREEASSFLDVAKQNLSWKGRSFDIAGARKVVDGLTAWYSGCFIINHTLIDGHYPNNNLTLIHLIFVATYTGIRLTYFLRPFQEKASPSYSLFSCSNRKFYWKKLRDYFDGITIYLLP